ncbi:MAG: hypothetical protein RMJ19_05215 [Gemmatales bacterium]|nr:hypothetical protein [Gemmatales bacterium]MDW8175052.1 hypothetical protein [Gemmatales bacterium]
MIEPLEGIHGRALVLWWNSTLGLLVSIGNRQQTEGPWVSLKKAVWNTLPALDVRSLSRPQLETIDRAFCRLARRPLKPLSKLARYPVRGQIDDVLAQILGLPDLSPLRKALGREPILTLKPFR